MAIFSTSDARIGYFVDPSPCGGGPNTVNSDMILDTWVHVAGTWDGTVSRLYINGLLVDQTIASFNASTWMTAGATQFNSTFSRFFKGELDEIRVWNIPRSATDIQSTMNRPLVGTEPGLVGYWRLDEGAGQFIGDLSSSGATGVLGTDDSIQSRDPVWVISGAPIR